MKRIALLSVMLLAACSTSYHKLRGVHDVWYTMAGDRVTVMVPTARTNDAQQARDQLLVGAAQIALARGHTYFRVDSIELATDQRGYGDWTPSTTGSAGLPYTAVSELYIPGHGMGQEIAIVGAAAPRGYGSTGANWKSVGQRAAGSMVIHLVSTAEGAVDAREILGTHR